MEVTSPPSESGALPATSGHPARRVRRLAAAIAALAVLAYGGWWLTHAAAFDPYGGSAVGGYAAVGDTGFFNALLSPEGGEVTVQDVTPVVKENSADAVVEVFFCRHAPGERYGGWGGEASAHCSETSPVRGATLTGPRPDGDIVVSVTPRREGRVVVEGLQVRYRDGLRWGRQHAGMKVDFTTAPPD